MQACGGFINQAVKRPFGLLITTEVIEAISIIHFSFILRNISLPKQVGLYWSSDRSWFAPNDPRFNCFGLPAFNMSRCIKVSNDFKRVLNTPVAPFCDLHHIYLGWRKNIYRLQWWHLLCPASYTILATINISVLGKALLLRVCAAYHFIFRQRSQRLTQAALPMTLRFM